jgi:hypothetical protein
MCLRCVGENPTLQNKRNLTNQTFYNNLVVTLVGVKINNNLSEKIKIAPSGLPIRRASYLYFSPKTTGSTPLTKYCYSLTSKEVALPHANFYQ